MSQRDYCYSCEKGLGDFMTCPICLNNFCRQCYMNEKHWQSYQCVQCSQSFCQSDFMLRVNLCNFCYYNNDQDELTD